MDSNSSVSASSVTPAGSYIVSSNYTCLPGFSCPNVTASNPESLPRVYQPGTYCTEWRLRSWDCPPQGPYEPSICPKGFYCPDSKLTLKCPRGNYCPTGTYRPFPCPSFSICDEGSYTYLYFGPFAFVLAVDAVLVIAVLAIWLSNYINKGGELNKIRRKRPSSKGDALSDATSDIGSPADDAAGDVNVLTEAFRKGLGGKELRIDFGFEDLALTLSSGKVVLEGVTGEIKSGRMTAVMGPSGAGKTSFMNLLMGKVSRTSGRLYVNGRELSMSEYKKVIGHVPQDDVMLRELTVRENIEYSARVRLPPRWTRAEVRQHVDKILTALNLTHVQHSRIGDELTRGVSGGQRKRVNIGMELAAVPLALFLDEPTSGLDSTAALSVVRILKSLSFKLGVTVVAVVHQPRKEIFDVFDDVLLIAPGGKTVYHGPRSYVRKYFEHMDFRFEVDSNPADTIMDILTGKHHLRHEARVKIGQSVEAVRRRWTKKNGGLSQRVPYTIEGAQRATPPLVQARQERLVDTFVSSTLSRMSRAVTLRTAQRVLRMPNRDVSGMNGSTSQLIAGTAAMKGSSSTQNLPAHFKDRTDDLVSALEMMDDPNHSQQASTEESVAHLSSRPKPPSPAPAHIIVTDVVPAAHAESGVARSLPPQSANPSQENISVAQTLYNEGNPRPAIVDSSPFAQIRSLAMKGTSPSRQLGTDGESMRSRDSSPSPGDVPRRHADRDHPDHRSEGSSTPITLSDERRRPRLDSQAYVTQQLASPTPHKPNVSLANPAINHTTTRSASSNNLKTAAAPPPVAQTQMSSASTEAIWRVCKDRGASWIRQVLLAHNRSVVQQFRMLDSLALETLVSMLAGGLMGLGAMGVKGELYRGVYKSPYSALSPAPILGTTPLYSMLIGMAIALASGPTGVKVFSEERGVYFRETSTGHSRSAYYLGKTVASFYRIILIACHFASTFYIVCTPITPFLPFFFFVILTYWGVYGLGSITSMLVKRYDAPLLACVVSLFHGVFCGFGPNLGEVAGWNMLWAWNLSFNRWGSEVMFSQAITFYAVYDAELATKVYPYTLGREYYDFVVMLAIGVAHRVVAFVLMLVRERDKQR